MRARRSIHVAPIIALFLWAALAPPAEAQAEVLLKKAAIWGLEQIASWGAGKVLDLATGQGFHDQLEAEIPGLVARVAATIGPQRAVFQESLELHREQLNVLTQLIDSQGKQGKNIAELKGDQERLLRRVENLEVRMTKLERRVDNLGRQVDELGSYVSELDARVSRLEDALIHECLDLRHADVLGKDGFRVKESPGAWSSDHSESDSLTLDARLLLNSCSGDLAQRGLLIQLSLVTRGLNRDISLYATFKGAQSGGRMDVLSRQEIPLARPGYRVDGQVVELFFPYGDILHLDRIALALVLTHDGEVLYALPDRVISCVFGQQVNCRWGR